MLQHDVLALAGGDAVPQKTGHDAADMKRKGKKRKGKKRKGKERKESERKGVRLERNEKEWHA